MSDMQPNRSHSPILYKKMMLSRNLEKHVFTPALTTNQSMLVKEQINGALPYLEFLKSFELRAQKIEERWQQRFLRECELFYSDPLRTNLKTELWYNPSRPLSLSINDTDHLRMTWLSFGESFEQIWQQLDLLDDDFSRHLDWAYREPYGYLSAKIEQVGTGLVGEALLHLPALKKTGFIVALAESMGGIGVQIKPYKGNFYKVYNTITLGRTEMEIAILLDQVVSKLCEREVAGRETLWASDGLKMKDQIGRSFGICHYLSIISENEAVETLSDILLGLDFELLEASKALEHGFSYKHLIKLSDSGLEQEAGSVLKSREKLMKRASLMTSIALQLSWRR